MRFVSYSLDNQGHLGLTLHKAMNRLDNGIDHLSAQITLTSMLNIPRTLLSIKVASLFPKQQSTSG